MSFRGRQSKILFSISASFVIFGSTVSNALPPQAITDEAKACRAISNEPSALRTTIPDDNWQIGRRANRQQMAVRKLWQQI